METETCRNLISLKSCIWTIILALVLFEVNVEATGYGHFVPIKRNICSQNCTKWKPKHCWDGYLKRKIWKMVCENYDIQCCPGYDGPNCENECFSCDKVKTIERRIVDIYGRIQAVEDKCTNSTVIIHGGGSENTDDKYTKECTCPAGPRGDMGPQGPAGPRGEVGPQGRAGAPGQPGNPGRPGQKGERGGQGIQGEPGIDGEYGADGLPGLPGQKGDPGVQGLPGLRGLTGEIGPEGPPGSPGSPGRVGRPGLPGSASAKGEPGLPGRDGLDGNPGRPGRNGEQGDIGVPGLPGRKGDKGDPGPAGMVGLPGERGVNGEAGLPGRPGYPGDDGATGPRGPEGQKGEPGRPGRDGRPGDITKVEESRVIQTLQNTIQNLETRLETVTKEVEELRIICNGIAGCRFNCTDESFKCSCGMCIPSRFRCDGFPQCPDGSDELEAECDYICDAGEFKCESSGLCIPVSKQCNGVIDCSDGSDESSRYCSDTINCNEGNVPCRDGSKCVAREERCDGKADCSDGSDEENCDCGREEFECASQDECIPQDRTCDNIPDCTDGSDESAAVCRKGIVCSEGRKACSDESACLNIEQFCDGIRNCYDGSDETNCELTPTRTSSTTKVDIRTVSKTPATTTTAASLITEEEIEGSGDLLFDQELCRELHAKWSDPTFPGGDAPPLHPGDEINQQLCNYMLLMAKESCSTGAGEISLNVELCKLVKNLELPSMNTRQKRHKHHKTTDDEELLNDGHYVSTKEEDISFDETDIGLINKVDIEPVAMAYSGSSSSTICLASLSLVFTCIFVSMVN